MSPHVKPSKVPNERDFAGGMISSISCSFVGSTGEMQLDEEIKEMAAGISGVSDLCLLQEMMISSVRTARGAVTEGDFKTMNRALKEMRYANEVFYPFRSTRKVGVFGSARTQPHEPEYQAAVDFSRKMRDANFMTITGAGPGIMAAGNEGAGREDSFGLNISLPFEATANSYIAGDEKLIDFNYFFTRKLSFVKESDAVAAFPGGFGTMDEIFETLTLMQTGKVRIYPLVLVDAPGGTYWKFWLQFVQEHLHRLNLISDSDFSLFKVTDNVDEAVEEITNFYRNFHSYRYVGDHLVIRLLKPLTKAAINKLQKDFKDVIKSGKIKLSEALPEEANEPRLAELPRLVFRHGHRDFGRLREMINAINAAEVGS
ncbi:LOG family protein [Persicirhabdus sediminis]|uniref:AMP nucleosidase n=1 Tax=Persicirhabdus sediminis TaxID=454144 RepID=A0A8J7SKS2_9BACT|nr:LOG family protein [Persicirhabdus sediminis]MBK1791906.1 LOG family protein [Persicirhabdus sediminis]